MSKKGTMAEGTKKCVSCGGHFKQMNNPDQKPPGWDLRKCTGCQNRGGIRR
jgi:hypothetical protein